MSSKTASLLGLFLISAAIGTGESNMKREKTSRTKRLLTRCDTQDLDGAAR